MTGAEDLTTLWTGQPPPPEPFRQGVVVAFNAATGANTIRVGGANLTDLPLLNIGDTVNIAVGNTVILMRFGPTLFILGRVLGAGSSVLNSSAVETQSKTAFESTFAVSTADQTRAELIFTVPAWANKATVMATGTTVGRNSTAASSYLYNRMRIAGITQAELFATAPVGEYVALAASSAATLTGLAGGSSIDVSQRPSTQTTSWASDANNRAITTAIAVFTRV